MVQQHQCGQEKFKIKFTHNDIMKIHNYVGVDFGPRVCTHNVGVNTYFGARRTNRTLPEPNYGLGNKNIIWAITRKVNVVHKTWKFKDKRFNFQD